MERILYMNAWKDVREIYCTMSIIIITIIITSNVIIVGIVIAFPLGSTLR